jgi:hypothetical protein
VLYEQSKILHNNYIYLYEMGPCHYCVQHAQVVTGGNGLCMHTQSFEEGKRLSVSINMQRLSYCLPCIALTVAENESL